MIRTHLVRQPSQVDGALGVTPDRPDLRHWTVDLVDLPHVSARLAGDEGPRTHLTVLATADVRVWQWPSEEQVAALLTCGIESVRLVLAGFGPAVQAGLLGFLAHAQSLGLQVGWRLPDGDPTAMLVEVDHLVHLPPPDGDSPFERSWADRHDYGLCYWRHGGTFATVTDVRSHDQAYRFTLSEPEYVALFTGLSDPRPMAGLSEAEQGVVGDLSAERLVVLLAGYVVRLPYRLRRWPMPLGQLR